MSRYPISSMTNECQNVDIGGWIDIIDMAKRTPLAFGISKAQ